MPISLEDLRQFATARSLFPPIALKRALHRMGFVQADPIRAPARAQDLILRHRVRNYRAGDLERRFETLGIEEDFFVTYGFVTRSLQALMHPRSETGVPADAPRPWPAARRKRAALLLEFIRERGAVHPREVDDHFAHGTVQNYWGGSSNATTHLLDAMHYRGLLRVARRERGVRIYSANEHAIAPGGTAERRARVDALVDVVVRLYAPLPARSLSYFVRRLRFAAPQWQGEWTSALQRARERLSRASAGGAEWYWPTGEDPARSTPDERVRLLTPFDPVVHDRARFELLWGWAYRFEAYTPALRRKLGYYALPLLWRDRVIGWGNVSVKNGELQSEIGYVGSPPRDRAFRRELAAEIERMRAFLGVDR
ncbi:MAG: winged helix DNA-binding domain-containing protein [Acidobacteria bacterium]|nr:winged helix DNA-binding domain-containing protein [Acidobacteriota bacterium]MCA1611345.1 winged helix DNA-binding domain-containing protein [Acidobacteriota bacterium]